jgi:hypothetical protein
MMILSRSALESALFTTGMVLGTYTTSPTTTVNVTPSPTGPSCSISTHATSTGGLWKPVAGTTWQIELSGTVTDTTYPADVFNIDLFDTPVSTITSLHANGKKVICYFSAGSYEDWRSDAGLFQPSDRGSPLEGWPGEWWLNTNSPNVRSIMKKRIELALSKGCDGVDPDNVDGYGNANGLGLTAADAISYVTFLADTAHAKGLSIGLKNAGGIVDSVVDIMEWHVNEQCLQYDECQLFQPFIKAGKPVFHIEYPSGAPIINVPTRSSICGAPSANGFSTIMKQLDLGAWIAPC